MAKVAIVKIPTPTGLEAIAVEIVTNDERLTIALEGSTVLNDPVLLTKVDELIKHVKDNYYGK
jgi:hypothetical protein